MLTRERLQKNPRNQILMMCSGPNMSKKCPNYSHIKAKRKSTAYVGDNKY